MTLEPPRGHSPWRQRVGGALFLVTGAGLVVHLLVGLPLWLTVFGGIGLATALSLSFGGTALAAELTPCLRAGLLSGLIATVAYDLSRTLFLTVIDSSMSPFAAWPLFGAGFVGSGAPTWAHWAVGGAYHVTNGLLFAVAFTVWLGDRGPLWGIAFALFLEAFMLGLYPGWLNIKTFGEFAQVSIVGHVVYGSVLGVLARRLTRPLPDLSVAP
jgi:hypothetical protein